MLREQLFVKKVKTDSKLRHFVEEWKGEIKEFGPLVYRAIHVQHNML